nr:MAG TPA: peptidase [Microviridae sp.]
MTHMNSELMNFIEWLLRRNIHFTVTSAFRTKEQNDACNGSKNSQHLTGDAVDLKPVDLSVDDFISLIKSSSFVFDQFIKYRTFVHVSFARGRKPRQMELNFTDRK